MLAHIVSQHSFDILDITLGLEERVSKEAEIDSMVQCIDLQIQMVDTILELLDAMTHD